MTALEGLASALAAYLASTPTLEQEAPEAAHLARAVEAVLALADDRALVELPPRPSLDDEALVTAYALASVGDPTRCGWRGPERASYPDAEADAAQHRRDHEAGWAAYNAALEDRDARTDAPAPEWEGLVP